MPDRITLYTSLPPLLTRRIGDAEAGFAYLAACVNSWKRAGFELISLNSAEEIRHLEKLGYDVECRPVLGNRPKISDFLAAILASRARVAGIVNADIVLADDPASLDALARHATGAMVVVERVNIDPRSLRPTGHSCYGFDAMIFGTEPLARIDEKCGLLFGEPWWDYWFPLAYAAAGGRLMSVAPPLVFHLD